MTIFEVRIVTFGRYGAAGTDRLAEWLATFAPEFVAFDGAQAHAAFAAFKTYGKGINPKATELRQLCILRARQEPQCSTSLQG